MSTLQLQKIFPYVGMWLTEGLQTFCPHLTSPHPRSYQKLHSVSMCLMEARNSKHHLTLLTLIFFHYVGRWLMEAFPTFITSPIQLKK